MPPKSSIAELTKQSPPVDLRLPFDASWVSKKTILITGGASGFGEAFFRRWAAYDAAVVIADIDHEKGHLLVNEVRKSTGNAHLHFVYCDVTDWQSQVDLFRKAEKLSPHGGIDAVVANAGIAEGNMDFEMPTDLDQPHPLPPRIRTMDVNLTGVLYTTHLALFHLARSSRLPATGLPRDRHLLLVGSIASLLPLPGQLLYSVSKHGVLGIFRNLRTTSHIHKIRVNLLCPYFIDTPIITNGARVLLAGGAMGQIEDVVDAASRLMDRDIIGRSLAVGPKVRVEQLEGGELALVQRGSERGEERAVWEVFAHDMEDGDLFVRRFLKLLNAVAAARGWAGWIADIVGIVWSQLSKLWR
ncbi:MAG: hypothetical protein M1829_005544 [Trizodia sp. TS-e1964]|nr:MAG: hypothetical protein M1829_005544 [Trizodia sp. TS-e1964]